MLRINLLTAHTTQPGQEFPRVHQPNDREYLILTPLFNEGRTYARITVTGSRYGERSWYNLAKRKTVRHFEEN
jgi:hypothetical protein